MPSRVISVAEIPRDGLNRRTVPEYRVDLKGSLQLAFCELIRRGPDWRGLVALAEGFAGDWSLGTVSLFEDFRMRREGR